LHRGLVIFANLYQQYIELKTIAPRWSEFWVFNQRKRFTIACVTSNIRRRGI